MRRRLVASTIAIVLVVLGALAVPVGLLIYRTSEDELRSRVETQASVVATELGRVLASSGGNDGGDEGAAELDVSFVDGLIAPADGVRIVGPDGDVVYDRRPFALDSPLTVTRTVAAPGGGQIYRVEVLTDRTSLVEGFRAQLSTLLLLALGGLAAAAALAAVQARQLARPLERLATSAARIGDGDFSTSALPLTGISEIDRISGALRTSGARVDRMLSAERHFTADATHQLRTGLTGLAMRFELLARHDDATVVAEAEAGLHQTELLDETISQLLEAARDGTSRERSEFDLVEVVDAHVDEWTGRFAAARRSLAVVTTERAAVVGTKGLAGQVIDVLLDNALVHGAGAVTVRVEGTSMIVADEGPGISDDQVDTVFDDPSDPAAAHGRGLPLARRLARVDGGSLDVVQARPLKIRYRLIRSARAASPPR